MSQVKVELVCLSPGDEEESEAVRNEEQMSTSPSEDSDNVDQSASSDESDSPPLTAVDYLILDGLDVQDPALEDEELERKLAENAAIGLPKLIAANKAFQRAAKLANIGKCKWLDSEDDSEDDEAEKAWKRDHQYHVGHSNSNDSASEMTK